MEIKVVVIAGPTSRLRLQTIWHLPPSNSPPIGETADIDGGISRQTTRLARGPQTGGAQLT